ncbi:MAG: GldG family protein [Anaerolineaceae bacterium]
MNILASMPENVTALAFFTPNYPTADTSQLLSNFKTNSLGKFDYQFIDPDSDPVSAKAANATRDGMIVLKMAGRQEQVTYPDEQEITSALIRLANPGTRVLYFLTGHGEIELNGSSGQGISLLKMDLESKNYSLKPLNLISTPRIPDDALAIIIDRPMQALSASEVQLIETFLASGKSLVLMMEPAPLTDFDDLPDPLTDYLENTWGITFLEDILIDPNVNPPLAAAADSYWNHPITQKMQGLVTIFPSARSMTVQPEMAQITTTELVRSSPNSWGETDFASINSNQLTFDEAEDLTGPLTIAAAVENTQNNSRIVVIGDSDFASDEDYRNYGNGIFIVNTIDWAAHQDNLIHLTVREKTQRMIMPPNQYTLGMVLFGSIFLIPLLILLSGIVVFIQRRRRS